jgi:glycosyltransferase involved in cell wall biosynthesis
MAPHITGSLVSWVKFQRRSKTLTETFSLELKHFHFSWEERSKALKIVSYLLKFGYTLLYLFSNRPRVVMVQLAPSPALYPVAIYCALTGARYLSDCHNTMIYDGHWIHWPLAKILLKRSSLVIVHNSYVQEVASGLGLASHILLDPPPQIQVDEKIEVVSGIRIKAEEYVILPCNMAADDEPAEEFFAAAHMLPHVQFVLTGYNEKLPSHLRQLIPDNVRYTGFLQETEFNALYQNAQAALVLSTREGTQPSGASEALALGVPLVVTDLIITRQLYKEHVVFTKNTANQIVASVQVILANRIKYSSSIHVAREEIALLTNDQTEKLKASLASMLPKQELALAL